MPAANAYTFLQLQDAVIGRRFPGSSQRDNAKRWLATAYEDVWSAARADGNEWQFEIVSRATIAMTSGDSTPTMPSDFGDALNLYDDSGVPMQRYSQEDFEYRYSDILLTSQTGLPEAYTVVNRQIEVAPIPTTTTFRLSYRRRLSHKESDGTTVTGGFFDEDTDYPLWDDHHTVLIPRATAIGLIEINDPTWDQAQQEYERQLARMKDDYVAERPIRQWGALAWDA
jgi:hypothetical protein